MDLLTSSYGESERKDDIKGGLQLEMLNTMFDMYTQVGMLAINDDSDENATVYVVWEVKEEARLVRLVELDRPSDGENHLVDLNVENVYLLEPKEVITRVRPWKD
jgi:hypothetical protein